MFLGQKTGKNPFFTNDFFHVLPRQASSLKYLGNAKTQNDYKQPKLNSLVELLRHQLPI
jgi:hypothetical protein